jgi:hypothetical protein
MAFDRVVDGSTELTASLFNELQEAIETLQGVGPGDTRFDDMEEEIDILQSGVFNVLSYGAVGDGVADDYQAVQDTLDAGAGHTIVFPPGEYLNDSNISWILPKYTRLQGLGGSQPFVTTGGVRLTAGADTTVDLIVGETIDHVSDYWAHGSQIVNISLFADAGQSAGSGLRWCPGENSALENVSFHGFPDAGMRIQGGMAPAFFFHLNFRDNKYGIWLDGDGDTTRGMVDGGLSISGISADNNQHLINIDHGDETNPNVSGAFLNLHLFGVKAETTDSGPYTTSAHNPLIRVYNPNGCMIEINGGVILNAGNTDATTNIIQFLQNGSMDAKTGVATIRNVGIRYYTNLIRDDILSESYAWTGDGDDWGIWRRLGNVSHRHLHTIRSEAGDQLHGFTLRGTSPALYLHDTSSDLVPAIMSGAGDPEGAVVAAVSSLWLRNDGSTNTALYIKQTGTGNTGWAAVTP